MKTTHKARWSGRVLTALLAAAIVLLPGDPVQPTATDTAARQAVAERDEQPLRNGNDKADVSEPQAEELPSSASAAAASAADAAEMPQPQATDARLDAGAVIAPLAASTDTQQTIVKGAAVKLEIKTTAVIDSAIALTWNTVEGATGYNVYNGATKLNNVPITENFYCAIGLSANTYYSFSVAALSGGNQLAKSETLLAATTAAPVTGDTLASAAVNDLNMEYSELALSLEYVGTAMSDPEYFYWCISPIDDDEGKTHLFVSRWKAKHNYGDGMNGWKNICEIAHCVGDTAEGPFKVVDIALSNDTMPDGQFSPHNIRVKKIDGKYVLIYITQGGPQQKDQKVCMATSDSLYGPWELQGDNKDGVVVQADDTGWTANSLLGTDNPDIIKVKDDYIIYFKAGIDFGSTRYGYAVSDRLEGGYIKSEEPITDNVSYIEDTTAFEMNGKIYLLTTDNFGGNTGIRGAGILWESEDGRSFKRADAQIGFGLLSDYMAVPPYAVAAYVGEAKFERPAVLMRDGKPAYFYAACGLNVDGFNATQNFVLKVSDRSERSTVPEKAAVHFDGNGSTGGQMADGTVALGSTYRIPENAFTKEGCVFAGWEASGAVTGSYADKDAVKYILDDVTLTAQWVQKEM